MPEVKKTTKEIAQHNILKLLIFKQQAGIIKRHLTRNQIVPIKKGGFHIVKT